MLTDEAPSDTHPAADLPPSYVVPIDSLTTDAAPLDAPPPYLPEYVDSDHQSETDSPILPDALGTFLYKSEDGTVPEAPDDNAHPSSNGRTAQLLGTVEVRLPALRGHGYAVCLLPRVYGRVTTVH